MYIAKACNGISGLDQASGAGERSSVFVSPGTLKTVVVIDCGTSGLDVNHSASAQDSKTFAAFEANQKTGMGGGAIGGGLGGGEM